MDAALAVITIRNRAALNAVFLSSHVLDDGSMDDDAVTFTDVLNVLGNTVDVVPIEGGANKWKAYGPLCNGESYAVVVEIFGESLFVVTCHNPP